MISFSSEKINKHRSFARFPGVSSASLVAIGATDGGSGTLGIPERDDTGRVTGVLWRDRKRNKRFSRGGTRGLYLLPDWLERASQQAVLYVTRESASDYLATLSMDFPCIGLPSAGGHRAMELAIKQLRKLPPAVRVVVISQNDETGRRAARAFAEEVARTLGRPVQILITNAKDVRAWLINRCRELGLPPHPCHIGKQAGLIDDLTPAELAQIAERFKAEHPLETIAVPTEPIAVVMRHRFNGSRSSPADYNQAEDDIARNLSGAGWRSVYESATQIKGSANSGGWVKCWRPDHPEDKRPKAVFNANTGQYHDFKTVETMSPWEFLFRVAQKFNSWRAAREYCADLAGVELPGTNAGPSRKKKAEPPKPPKPAADASEKHIYGKESCSRVIGVQLGGTKNPLYHPIITCRCDGWQCSGCKCRKLRLAYEHARSLFARVLAKGGKISRLVIPAEAWDALRKRMARAGADGSLRIYATVGGQACFVCYSNMETQPDGSPVVQAPLDEMLVSLKEELRPQNVVADKKRHPLSWSPAWRPKEEDETAEEGDEPDEEKEKFVFVQRVTHDQDKQRQVAAAWKDRGVQVVDRRGPRGPKIEEGTLNLILPPRWDFAIGINREATEALKREGRDARKEFEGLALADHPEQRVNYAEYLDFLKDMRLGKDCRGQNPSCDHKQEGFRDNAVFSFVDSDAKEPLFALSS
jgi:hypothetical protein